MSRPPEYERMVRSMREFFRLIGRSSRGAHVVELPGVTASVCPRVPGRSLPNSVVYETEDALVEAVPQLARHYDEAGIDAWTVWVPDDHAAAAAALSEAGHVLDADPAAMTLDLAQLEAPDDDIEFASGDELMPVVASINDAAYTFEGTPFSDFSENHPHGVSHSYVAYVDGQPVSALMILPVEGDASVWDVATLPEMGGRGLTTRLMRRALWDARERGCDLSTLQATKAGEPVYARMGYRSHGALQMWERRS